MRLQNLLLLIPLILLARPALAEQRLLMGGGGDWSADAKARMLGWAHQGEMLFVNWGAVDTEDADERIARFKERFATERPGGEGIIEGIRSEALFSSDPKKAEKAANDMLAQIERAKFVYFAGGDQDRFMKVLTDPKFGKRFSDAIRKKYESGEPVGSTAGGTAIMSEAMVTSDSNGPKIAKGYALLPKNVVVDQHLKQSNREGRLTDTWKSRKDVDIAIGIDDDAVCEFTNGKRAKNLGPDNILILDKKATPSRIVLTVGETYDLELHQKLQSAGEPAAKATTH